MSPDHYAILGVAPTAQPAVIRAAYLALMREFHPDRNPNPAAAGRAQAIVEAYKVLGDFDRRQEYDWGRRRAREAAAAIATTPKRNLSAGVVIAAAFGLAVAGAVMLRPGPNPMPQPDRQPDVEIVKPASVSARRAKPPPTPVVEIAERTPVVMPVPKFEPVEMVPELYPAPEPVAVTRVAAKATETKQVARAPVAKEVSAAKATPTATISPWPKLAMVVRPPPPTHAPKSVARSAAPTDLAALDQFVMNFYGQSWRFGDTKRRAALEQSRNLFVVRRAACAVDSCKRSEYLRLQREVSAIVESGLPR